MVEFVLRPSPDLPVIGQELVDRQVVRSLTGSAYAPGPCPICGNHNGSCEGSDNMAKGKAKSTQTKPSGGAESKQQPPVETNVPTVNETQDQNVNPSGVGDDQNQQTPPAGAEGGSEGSEGGDPAPDTTEAVSEPLAGFQARPAGAPEGRIIEPGDDVVIPGNVHGNMVTVSDDVYQKFYPRNSLRPSYSLLYRAGHVIPANALKSLGRKVEKTTDNEK